MNKPKPEFPANPNNKIQKKVYLTEKASWYLSMIQNKTGRPYGEIIEELITNEFESREK